MGVGAERNGVVVEWIENHRDRGKKRERRVGWRGVCVFVGFFFFFFFFFFFGGGGGGGREVLITLTIWWHSVETATVKIVEHFPAAGVYEDHRSRKFTIHFKKGQFNVHNPTGFVVIAHVDIILIGLADNFLDS